MKIAVCLKEVLDARLPLQVEARTGSISHTGTERVNTLNPADRSALEAAMQLREQIARSQVDAFSVCDSSGQEALWFARARGADYVERIENDSPLMGAPYTAALLAIRFEQAHFDLICCGDETLDNSSAIVGPLLAEILDLPQVTGVLRLAEHHGHSIVVERGLERGNRELVEMVLPGLVTLRSEGSGTSLRVISQVTGSAKPRDPATAQQGSRRPVRPAALAGEHHQGHAESAGQEGIRAGCEKLTGGAHAHDYGRRYSAPGIKG